MWMSHPLRTLIPSLDGAVLEALAGTTLPLNSTAIARVAAGGSPSGIRLVLNRLERDGLVTKDKAGRGFFSANRDHVLWSAIAEAFASSSAWREKVRVEIAGWEVQPLSLAVFGSVARGDDNPESDLDLLIVWSPTVDERTVGAKQHQLGLVLERAVGTSSQFYSVTPDSLSEHADSGQPIFQEWVSDAQTVFGLDIGQLLREAARGAL